MMDVSVLCQALVSDSGGMLVSLKDMGKEQIGQGLRRAIALGLYSPNHGQRYQKFCGVFKTKQVST